MDLPVIILSPRLAKTCAQGDGRRDEEGHRCDHYGRRVERVLDRLRQADDREGEHDRRHAEEQDDERQEEDGRREGSSVAAARLGEPIEFGTGGVRKRAEHPEQPEDGRDGPAREEDDAAEHDGKGETRDLRDDRDDPRMYPASEERQRRREDEEGPGRREQGTSLEIEAKSERIGEGDGEDGQGKGEEKTRDESGRTPSRQFDDGRSADPER